MIRKLMITPFFGPLPPWWDNWLRQTERLKTVGYDFLITHDLNDFARRCKAATGLEPVGVKEDGRKMCDWRAMFGRMFEHEIQGYDFWGFTDQDCLYGRVEKWVTDEFLGELDVHSNHPTYICGPWSLFRSCDATRDLYLQAPDWQERVLDPKTNGWVEMSYSRALEQSGLRYAYTFWQPKDQEDFSRLRREGDALYDGIDEIMLAHFRRRKIWPL